MNSRASRLVLALSAFVFAVGGVLHARAFRGAEAAIGRANLPSIYACDFCCSSPSSPLPRPFSSTSSSETSTPGICCSALPPQAPLRQPCRRGGMCRGSLASHQHDERKVRTAPHPPFGAPSRTGRGLSRLDPSALKIGWLGGKRESTPEAVSANSRRLRAKRATTGSDA